MHFFFDRTLRGGDTEGVNVSWTIHKNIIMHTKIDQLVIPDELPCFDLTQIRMRILQFYKGLFESISLLFAWRAVCVEFISCSPLSN